MGQSASKGGQNQFGSNPFVMSAMALNGAASSANAASNAAVNSAGLPTSYSPVTTDAVSYGNTGYGNTTYGSTNVADPSTIAAGMGTYANPFQEQVINNAERRINENLAVNLRDIGSAAHSAGAFGGSRHGIVEGQAVGDAAEAVGDIAAQMGLQGFNTAAGLSAQDIANQIGVGTTNASNQIAVDAGNAANQIAVDAANAGNETAVARDNSLFQMQNDAANAERNNAASEFGIQMGMGQGNQAVNNFMAITNLLQGLSQQGFETGRTINSDQAGQGQIAQVLNQGILDAGNSMFDTMVGQPAQVLQSRLASLGASPLNNQRSETTSTNPGAAQIFGNLLGAAGNAFSFSPIKLF